MFRIWEKFPERPEQLEVQALNATSRARMQYEGVAEFSSTNPKLSIKHMGAGMFMQQGAGWSQDIGSLKRRTDR